LISAVRGHRIDRALLALLVALAAGLLFAAPAGAAPWMQPGYLYRYFVWGAQFLVRSRADDYKRYGYHAIDKSPDPFHFAPGNRDAVPYTVEYKEGDAMKRVALSELLSSTGTHAFIVIRDNQVLYENYFNGYERDSLCTAWSLSKSVTSALVGIAISEGYIKSLDDPITNYLPELKDQSFGAITIRNLLTMGSGIQYRIGFFPWDEFVLAGYYPSLRQLLVSDLRIMEPAGQSFHYNNFNVELLGLILERTTHRPPSQYLQEENLEAYRHGIPSYLEYRQQAGRLRGNTYAAQRESYRLSQVRTTLLERWQLGRQADRPGGLGRRIHSQRSE